MNGNKCNKRVDESSYQTTTRMTTYIDRHIVWVVKAQLVKRQPRFGFKTTSMPNVNPVLGEDTLYLSPI